MVKGLLTLLLAANTKGFDSALGRSGAKLKGFQKNVALATTALGYFGGAMAIVSIVRNVTDTIIRFDSAMTNLAAILGVSRDGMKRLEEQAIALGGATIFTANEIGDLQTILARFGFDQTEIENSTAAILDLAAAAGIDLSTAADAAASTLRAFQLDSVEMGRVTDVMTNAFTGSALTVETFGEAMKYAAPLAKAAGVSIEETAAMLGVLADNGLRGSIAGTSLRRIFTELARSGKSITEIFREAGGDANFLADALGFADDAVGKYALSSFIVLAENAGLIEQNTKAFGELGSSARIADQQLGSLANQYKILKSQWEKFILSVDSGNGALSTTISLLYQLGGSLLDIAGSIGNGGVITQWKIDKENAVELAKQDNLMKSLSGDMKELEDLARSYSKNLKINSLDAELMAASDLIDSYRKLLEANPTDGNLLKQLNKIEDVWNELYAKKLDGNVNGGLISPEQEELMNEMLGNVKEWKVEWSDITNQYEKTFKWVHKITKEEKEAADAAEAARKLQITLGEKFQKQQEEILGYSTGMVVYQDSITDKYYEQLEVLKRIALLEMSRSNITTDAPFGVDRKGSPQINPTGTVVNAFPEGVNADIMNNLIQNIEAAKGETDALSASMVALGNTISNSLAQGASSWDNYAGDVGKAALDIVSNLAMVAVAAAIASSAKLAASLGPVGLAALGALSGVAIGLIRTAFSNGRSQATEFADGGVVSGPTYAMVGEYGNARNNPEVIAPLDKLKTMLGDVGGGKFYGELVLKNNTLVAAIDREHSRSKRYGAR